MGSRITKCDRCGKYFREAQSHFEKSWAHYCPKCQKVDKIKKGKHGGRIYGYNMFKTK